MQEGQGQARHGVGGGAIGRDDRRDGGWIITNSYTWQNGNLTKTTENGEDEGVFTYDNKKSPFYYCQTPKWYLLWWIGFESENNRKTETWNGSTPSTYDYTYLNEEGFPVTQTKGSSTMTYTYKKQ